MNDWLSVLVLGDHAVNHMALALRRLEVRHRLVLGCCLVWRINGDFLAVVEVDVARVAWLLLIDCCCCHEFSSFFLAPNVRPSFAMSLYCFGCTAP